MNFLTYGEFPIARNGNLVAHKPVDRRAFWNQVDEKVPGLSDACGCYIFITRNHAWYVGMAERQSFKKECFSAHKIIQYNEALGEVGGKPSLLLLPKMTPGKHFAKPAKRGHADIRMLESLLIGTAITRNPKLRNVKGTKLLKSMNVPGFLNSGQGQARSKAVQQFKKALGL